jgi:hypothetical protein
MGDRYGSVANQCCGGSCSHATARTVGLRRSVNLCIRPGHGFSEASLRIVASGKAPGKHLDNSSRRDLASICSAHSVGYYKQRRPHKE